MVKNCPRKFVFYLYFSLKITLCRVKRRNSHLHKGPPYGQDRRKKRTPETVRRAAIQSRKDRRETFMACDWKRTLRRSGLSREKGPRDCQERRKKRHFRRSAAGKGSYRRSGTPQEKGPGNVQKCRRDKALQTVRNAAGTGPSNQSGVPEG